MLRRLRTTTRTECTSCSWRWRPPEAVHARRHLSYLKKIQGTWNNVQDAVESEAKEFGSLCYHDWLRTLEVNTLGTVRVAERLLENTARTGKRLIVAVSSHMGSIADIQDLGSYYYLSSKAALNAAMQGIAVKYDGTPMPW